MQMTPQQLLIANAYRRSMAGAGGMGPAVPPVPILPGTSGADVGGRPTPSSGGFNLDKALIPSPEWAPRSPTQGDPITNMFRRAMEVPAQYQFDTPAPPVPKPRPMGTAPQVNYDAPPEPVPPGQRQMNYGDTMPPVDPAAGPMPPMLQPRPAAPPLPQRAAMAQQSASPWPPMPNPRPEMQGPPAANAQPEGIDSAGNVAALGAGMAPAPDASSVADAMGGVSPGRASSLWDNIRTKFNDPDMARNLMTFGLATLAASGRPGTSAAAALGEGGLATMNQAEQRRRLDIQQGQLARQERRDDRRLSLQEQQLVQEAELKRQQWIEMANRSDLDRDARTRAAEQARELRLFQIQTQAGNAQAAQQLQALIAQGNQALRRDGLDRLKAEDERRAEDKKEADALKLQADIDTRANLAADAFIKSQRNKDTGKLPGSVDEDEVRNTYLMKNWGKSSVGKALLDTPAEVPTVEEQIAPGSWIPEALGGAPPQMKRRADVSKMIKGKLYIIPNSNGQTGRFNGSGLDPVQ